MFTETLFPPPKCSLLFHISFASAPHLSICWPLCQLVKDGILAWLRSLAVVCWAFIAKINISVLCANPPDQSRSFYIKSQYNFIDSWKPYDIWPDLILKKLCQLYLPYKMLFFIKATCIFICFPLSSNSDTFKILEHLAMVQKSHFYVFFEIFCNWLT